MHFPSFPSFPSVPGFNSSSPAINDPTKTDDIKPVVVQEGNQPSSLPKKCSYTWNIASGVSPKDFNKRINKQDRLFNFALGNTKKDYKIGYQTLHSAVKTELDILDKSGWNKVNPNQSITIWRNNQANFIIKQFIDKNDGSLKIRCNYEDITGCNKEHLVLEVPMSLQQLHTKLSA